MTTSSSHWEAFPVELLDKIAGRAQPKDLLELARTSRQTHDVCIRHIYATVVLKNGCQAITCFKTLISNAGSARCVRKLVVGDWDTKVMLEAALRIVQVAMNKLEFLSAIHFAAKSKSFELFSSIHFPGLRTCVIPLTLATVHFLQRHPNLAKVVVIPVEKEFWPLSIPGVAIPMAHLQSFIGPDIIAEVILPGFRLSHIKIISGSRRLSHARPIPTIIDAVTRGGAKLKLVHYLVTHWDTALFPSIAAHAPSVTSVHVQNEDNTRSFVSSEVFISSVDDVIAALQDLKVLQISQRRRGTVQTEPLSQELAAEFELVRRWGDRVPALTYCFLPSETTWVRLRGHNVFTPVASDHSEAGNDIRQDWLYAALRDSPSLIQEYGLRDAWSRHTKRRLETTSIL
ncbi:hypothetical protein GGX14DRAFT_633846 [Mycena pura]|uniref:F-box domain-containing protein n=1 Tax=Mycena pura TaxID=153505 RepID=A0AAD6VFI3_9AGAR|nr:hypothetical protein GGX14DRAFT_633846 [Mycena pura]